MDGRVLIKVLGDTVNNLILCFLLGIHYRPGSVGSISFSHPFLVTLLIEPRKAMNMFLRVCAVETGNIL